MTTRPTCILPHVYLGSKVHAKDREMLQELHITHILNVTPPRTMDPAAGVPHFFEKDKKLTYRRCAMYDSTAENLLGVLEGCISFIEQAKYYGRILVHCNRGVSRSAAVVIAYVIKTEKKSYTEALEFVTKKHPLSNPNAAFRKQLQAYETRLTRNLGKDAKKKEVRTRPIGPQRPPHLQEKARSDDEQEQPSSSSSKRTIGPSLPPTKRQRSESAEDDDTAPPEKKIATKDE